MIRLAQSDQCTGCAACQNVCNKSAIRMKADGMGFLQPNIDKNICVECGLCEKRCPTLHPLTTDNSRQRAYAIINYADRKLSSSGGAFSLFARYVLDKGGVVFGATIDENQQVYHTAVHQVEDLNKLRGSKYVQSDIRETYKKVKHELVAGKRVLFSGTPCQVAGLYAYLGARYDEKLITLDLVCHGVPNQEVFNAYLKKLKKSTRLSAGSENIEGVRFRKLDSWDYRPAVKFAKSHWKILTQEDNAYMSAFFRGLTYRESCFRCQYTSLNRVGDFTIADFWGIGRHGVRFKTSVASGVSLVLDNCGKMADLLPVFLKSAYIEERTLSEAIAENGNLKHPVSRPKGRDTAIMDILDEDISLRDFASKYNLVKKENLRYHISKSLKNIIYAMGLYNVYKSISYKMGL